ncbi:cytochrome P450 [Stachybotrys elegans]|uniref:Cytochrome P450 n=1 Tax=Stachybotrys elegans TaxID=80388 RepID=A0A8K0WLJ1_9HYPO|nr:cytochrome P450 [Stachybotrys elegans]
MSATQIPNGSFYGSWFIIVITAFITRWVYRYSLVRRSVKGLPQIHSALGFFESGARTMLPHIPFIWPANAYAIDDPWKKYADAGSDLIALTQLSTPDHAVYITSSPEAAQLILAKSSVFLKPLDMFRYRAINIFGNQIVSVQNGLDHKRHKLAVKACFGESTMQEGWNSMASAFQEMMRQERLEVGGVISDTKELMNKVTMRVICKSWFGMDSPWTIQTTKDALMPFYEALHIVEGSLVAQLLFPLWFMEYNPLPSLRRFGNAQRCMVHHLHMMAESRRSELIQGTESRKPIYRDVLGSLVAAQVDDRGAHEKPPDTGLSKDEVIGNIFIFVVAGHETTSNTLTFTLAFLALYPEWQEKLRQEISEATEGLLSYECINALPLVLATCYEAMRLRDLVMTLPKVVQEDVKIPYRTWTPDGKSVERERVLPKGAHVVIDSPASQRNPFYWDDSKEFKPTRHLVGNRLQSPNFTGFSKGERKCIGKRFAEVEMVCFVSHLVKTFTWSAVTEAGETAEQLKNRLLHGTEALSLTPGTFGLKFEKRSGMP